MSNNCDNEQPTCKKLKTEIDLKKFVIEETLNNKTNEKVLILKGKFSENDNALLIFEKSPFPEDIDELKCSIANDSYQLNNIMTNDIYCTELINGMQSINPIKLTVINPATEKHFAKYLKPSFHILSETVGIYNEITLPFVNKNSFSNVWIDNLLDNKAELDRILFGSDSTENGFVFVMDFKWDGRKCLSMETLHCIAIVADKRLRSLRDLNETHLPLLREINEKCSKAIEDKYGIAKSQLRFYFHYPPSFYHLHVHVTHVGNDSSGAHVDRAHLLSTVVRNIERDGRYYEEATIDVTVNVNDPLYHLYKANKYFD